MSNSENGKVRSFKDLMIWQKAIELAENIYVITKSFPDEEKYGLTIQLRRASVSIASNIAEGFGRYYNKDYQRFLFIAIGSCAEVYTQVIIAQRLDYISDSSAESILTRSDEISKMTRGLINKLKNK